MLTAAKIQKDGAKYVGGFAFSIDLRLEQTDDTWWWVELKWSPPENFSPSDAQRLIQEMQARAIHHDRYVLFLRKFARNCFSVRIHRPKFLLCLALRSLFSTSAAR